jgi:transcriptional regulator with XRE-family HTH domain
MDDAKQKKRLGAAIRARREALELSQDRFADVIGMHRAQYAAIDRGEVNVTFLTLVRIAEGLGAKASSLLADAGL